MADIDNLKSDIDKIGTVLRTAEKEIYERINITDKNVGELNTSVKIVVEKLTSFIDTFKSHDTNEMQKYDDILDMFKQLQDNTKKTEEKINEKFVTKDELKEINKRLTENSNAIKQGFKIFYIGTGVFITVGIVGSLIMYILNLISKLQSLGVH